MLYLEDVAEGQRFAAGPTAPIALSDISAFANRFDPQPFHVDPTAAKETFFGEIVASGWHTASLTMRLLTDAVPSANGLIGSAVEELQWPSPVRPGDSLPSNAWCRPFANRRHGRIEGTSGLGSRRSPQAEASFKE